MDIESNQQNQQFPLDSDSYKIVAEIGSGSSGVVYKAICVPKYSTMVAIKTINLDRARPDLEDETNIMMSLLSHPNLLQAHCSFIVERCLWVVMPFMSAGSLLSILTSSFPDGLPESCMAVVLKETLSAVAYLHDQGHFHGDIKAGNILMDSNGSVKLADFGVSAEPRSNLDGSSSSSSSTSGTPYHWMAPEMIQSSTGYSFKADIWSFGITALELAYGRPPISVLPPLKSPLLKITQRFRFSDWERLTTDKNKKFSKNFRDMVGSCLRQDPSKRPTAEKLLNHPFFKNCRFGADILVKNVLQGLPRIEDRFKGMNAQHSEEDDDSKWYVKARRINGWNFNPQVCELDPVFPHDDLVGKKVRFGGESIIESVEPREADGDGLSSPTAEEEDSQVGISEKEGLLLGLLKLKKSVDYQKEKVDHLVRSFRREQGGEEMMSREDHMGLVIQNLTAELEREKMKNTELQGKVDVLKMQLYLD